MSQRLSLGLSAHQTNFSFEIDSVKSYLLEMKVGGIQEISFGPGFVLALQTLQDPRTEKRSLGVSFRPSDYQLGPLLFNLRLHWECNTFIQPARKIEGEISSPTKEIFVSDFITSEMVDRQIGNRGVKIAIQVSYDLSTSFTHHDDFFVSPIVPPATRQSLYHSLTGIDDRDTKFILYRKKPRIAGDAENGGFRPPDASLGVVYARSSILKARSSYFKSHQAFAEGATNDSVANRTRIFPKFEDSFDYDSDSDLETESNEPKDVPMSVEEGDSVLDKSQSDDAAASSNVVQDTDKHIDLDDDIADISKRLAATNIGIFTTHMLPRLDPLHIIIVPDVAFKTWVSLMAYLYTGTVSFAPLSSELNKGQADQNAASCKSLYRVADKLGLAQLQERSLAHLKLSLTPRTIIPEIFSTFTSRYDKVKELEIKYFLAHRQTITVQPLYRTKLEELVAGKLPHCGWLIQRLLIPSLAA